MKINCKNNLFLILLCSSVFLIGACTKESSSTTQKENQTSLTIAVESIANAQSLTIESDKKEVALQLKDTGWESSELSELDNTSIDTLITNLMSIQGTAVKETKEMEEFFEQPDTTFNWTSKTDSHNLEFVSNEQGDWVKLTDENVYYQISSVTYDIKTFEFVYIQPPIKLAVEDPSEIEINSKDQSVVLNTETSMNAVEASPFISGWFLQGSYQTEFSVEYQKMESFYNTLTNLKGTKVEELVDEQYAAMILILKDGKQEESLFIKETEGENKNYYVTINSDQQTYEVPAPLMEQFSFDPLAIVDNFISIMPLSAIQSIEVQQKNQTTTITAKHKLTADNKDETTIQSTFYVGEKKLPETTFRKTYQYLASLSYDSVLKEDEKTAATEEDEIKITYIYLNDGKEEKEIIRFMPVVESEYYAVEKNGIFEFKTSKETVQTALNELEKVTN